MEFSRMDTCPNLLVKIQANLLGLWDFHDPGGFVRLGNPVKNDVPDTGNHGKSG